MGYDYDRRNAARQPDSKTLQMALSAMEDVLGAVKDAANLELQASNMLDGTERPMTYALKFIREIEDEGVRRNLLDIWHNAHNGIRAGRARSTKGNVEHLVDSVAAAMERAKSNEKHQAMWDRHLGR